jgi:hypothetical protein
MPPLELHRRTLRALRKSRTALLLAIAALEPITGCGGERAAPPDRAAGPAPAVTDTVVAPPLAAAPRRPSYRPVGIDGARALARLRQELGERRFDAVLKVNRRDLRHVREGDTLAVPDTLHDWIGLSPFPAALTAAADHSKLLLISLRVQAFAAYDSGRLSRWGPTSTGREEQPTPAGLYHTNWKDKERTSTFNDEWLLKWYVNLHNTLGISLHLYDLPGYPASHSCVRLLEDDAIWLYEWAESWNLSPDGRTVLRQGSPVVVFGEYAWDRRPPWRELWRDSTATDVSAGEIEEALIRWLPRSGVAEAGDQGDGPAHARGRPLGVAQPNQQKRVLSAGGEPAQ